MLGIILAALLSALLSALSAILNSTSTLFTMDFYAQFRPNTGTKKMVWTGKITSLIVIIIAALWAPHIGKFGSLLKYYQEMLSYIAPPIVAAFLLGIFGKRVNGTGAFTGLIAGLLTAVVLLFFKTHLFGHLHFLLVVPFLLLFSMAVIYGVSLLSRKPEAEKLNNTVFSMSDLKKEWRGLSAAGWYKNYLFWAIVLLVSSALIWIIFR